jgi:hypothetical protein
LHVSTILKLCSPFFPLLNILQLFQWVGRLY